MSRPSLLLLALSALLLLATHAHAYTKPSVVKIGAVLPLTGSLAGAGQRAWILLNQSVSELRVNLPGVLNGTQLELVVADNESSLSGTTAAALQLSSAGVAVMLGAAEGLNLVSNKPIVTRVAGQPVGIGAGSAQTSVLIWGASSLPLPRAVLTMSGTACTRRDFLDTELYPNLVRMCVSSQAKSVAMLDAFAQFGWKKVAIIAQDDADGWGANSFTDTDPVGNILGPGQAEADFIVEQLMTRMSAAEAKENILRLRIPMQPQLASESLPSLLHQLQDSGIRIVVVYVQGLVLIEMLRMAAGLGMMQTPYVWIGAGTNSGPASTAGLGTGTVASGGMGAGLCSNAVIAALADLTPAVPSVASSAGRLVSAYQSSTIGAASTAATYVYQADLAMTSSPLLGSICFTPATLASPAFTNVKYRLLNDRGLPFDSILSSGDAATYDSVLVAASAIDALIKAETAFAAGAGPGEAVWPAETMWAAMAAVDLPTQGLGGPISFRADNGDRIGQVDLLNYDPLGSASGSFVSRGRWSELNSGGGFNFTDAIIWADYTSVLPPDHVDKFQVGEEINVTFDGSIIALAYFYVLLPSALLIYNTRRFMRTFIDGGGSDFASWAWDIVRALGFFSIAGVFAMTHLHVLAMSVPTGSFWVAQDNFAGGLIFTLVVALFVAPLPLLVETWWKVRKGGLDALAVAEDFELHLENGEEVSPAAADAAAAAAGAKGEVKGKDGVVKAAPSAKEKARAARAKARKGGLTSNDEANFIQREVELIWEKLTPGLALTAAVLAAVVSGEFYLALTGLVMPVEVEIDAGQAFGSWLLTTVLFVPLLVRAFKDSRNFWRVVAIFFWSAVLLLSFHVHMTSVTLRYTEPISAGAKADGVDMGGVAIAHAIFFAIPFFAGLLQLIKALKLSRHSLDSILNNMKAKLASLESGLEAAKNDRKTTAADTDHLKRLLELSNLCRPLHRNHALAFTMAETTSGVPAGAGGAAAKPFVPASFTQELRAAPATRVVQQAPSTPKQSGGIGAFKGVPATPSGMPERSMVNMSGIKLLPDATPPQTPLMSGAAAPRKSAGLAVGALSPGAGAAGDRANLSQGIAAASLSGLDFGFLARPKAEQTGYKLLNELSLELFLASGPVHHRAVADVTLAHILSHPITLELFKDSLTRAGAQEALAFWMDIQRYKQLEAEDVRRAIAEAMTATFLYSDAPHPVNFLSPAAREGVLNVIFAKKSPRRAMFHVVEAELLAHLAKEHANFATTTSFKVCAFLLGHSSYAPSTRIKTLNAGGAAVGAGGALVPVTQNVPGGGGVFGEGSQGSAAATGLMGAGGVTQNAAGHGNFFDPESSIGTGAGIGAGAPSRLQLNVDIKAAAAGGGASRLKGAAADGAGAQNPSPKAATATSPSPLYKSVVANKAAAAAAAASAALSPSNAGGNGDAAQCMSPSANGASASAGGDKDGGEGDAVPLAADLLDSSAPVAAAAPGAASASASTPAVLVVADDSDAASAAAASSPAPAASPKADHDEDADEDEQLLNKQQQQEEDA